MLNRRSVRFVLLLSGVLGVFVVVLLVQEQSIFGRRRRFSPPADANASTSSPLSSSADRSGSGSSSLAVQGARVIAMETLEETGEKVKKYSIVIGETIGAVSKRTRARHVEVQIFNKKPAPEERVVAIIRGDEAAITFVEAPDVAGGFSGSEIEALVLQSNVVVDYLDEAGERAAKLTTDEMQIDGLTMNTYVPRRAFIDQEGMHIEGDGLRYSKARGGSFSFERNVVVEGSAFRLPSSDPTANEDAAADAVLRRITCAGPFDYAPSEAAIDESARSETDKPSLKSGVLTFRDDVVGSQEATKLLCSVLEITLDNSAPATDDADSEGGGTRITKVVATGTRDRAARLDDARGTFIAEVLSMEKVDLGDVLVLKNDARIENARFGAPGADPNATDAQQDLLNAAAKTLIRVEPQERETEDAPERMKILLRDAAYLAIQSTAERSFRIDGEEIDVFVVRKTDDEGAEQMELERLNSRLRARGEFAQGSFTADDVTVRPKAGAADPSDFDIELRPNPRIDLTPEASAGVERKVVVVGVDCVAVISPPAQEGAPVRATFTGKNEITVDENGQRSLTMDAARSLTIDAPGKGSGGTKVTAVGSVSFKSPLKNVDGNGETVELQILEDESQKVTILAAAAGPLARVTLADEERVGNEISARRIEFDPKTNVLEADGSVHAVVPNDLLVVDDGEGDADAKASNDAAAEPGTLDSDHLVVRLPNKDEETGETPETLVLEATGRARYANPAEGLVATGHRLVFDQSTALATVYGNDDEDALVLRSANDPKVKVQELLGVGGNVVILHQDTKTLECPDRGSVVIKQPVDPQDVDTEIRSMLARSAGPVRFADDRLVLRQNVVVTFEQAGIEDRAMHCDKLTVLFAKREDGADATDLDGPAPVIERILAEGRVSIEQAGDRPLRAGGDIAEWLPNSSSGNFIELRAPAPLCWAEMDGPDDFVRYDGTSVKIWLDSKDVSTGPGEYEKVSKKAKP